MTPPTAQDSGNSRLEPTTPASILPTGRPVNAAPARASSSRCDPVDAHRDDVITFPDDDPPTDAPAARTWKVLVVDDDPDVHDATAFALRGVRIAGRPLELLHAHSVASAQQRLAVHPDVAVALVDVVMETPDAGLRLARSIREDQGLRSIRIVMRTGQPGHASEREVLAGGGVDDFLHKSEMTRERLMDCLARAIDAHARDA